MFYNLGACRYYNTDIATDSWNQMQMVSVSPNDDVIGYLACKCDRSANIAYGVAAINYGDINLTFSIDFFKFLDSLFTLHHFNKIEWEVVIGNPAEKMYDKIIKKYNGRIIGVKHESTKLIDGQLYDMKEYELFARDYLKVHKS